MGLLKNWKAPIVLTFSAGPNAALLTAPDVSLWVADADCEVLSVTERHETLGTDAGAVTADVRKVGAGVAASGGSSLLASTFNLKAAINTLQSRSKAAGTLATDRTVSAGQCIAIDFGGTMTAVTGVLITVTVQRLRKPAY